MPAQGPPTTYAEHPPQGECESANPGCGSVAYAPAAPIGTTLGVTINPRLAQFGAGTEDVLVNFSVATTNGKPLINDLSISSDSAETGTGIVSDDLRICTTANCGTVLFHTLLMGNSLGIRVSGAPQSVIWVSEDMNAPVASTGLATMTPITQVVS